MARTNQTRPSSLPPPLTVRTDGTIKRLVRERGFGFIRDRQGKDYFFHHSELLNGSFDELQEDVTLVSFDATEGAKGLRANAVEIEH